MTISETKALLGAANTKALFEKMYGCDQVDSQRERYSNLLDAYTSQFGEGDVLLFTSAGRTEIGGNHTDHNYGKVLAGSINLDCIGIAAKNTDNTVVIHDITYKETFAISLDDLEKREGERGSVSLVRGIIKGFKEFGLEIGGFNVVVTSNVIAAAGVSSSASFEMLICSIMDQLYNNGSVDKVTYARIGQYSENVYWDKQSGLLDQMACSVGGIITIDFEDPTKPVVEPIDFDFGNENHSLIIVNTGKGHADLSAEYSSIPIEMKSVAGFFGKKVCREITMDDILSNYAKLRGAVGDRAVLRAMHFLEENKKVDGQVAALKNGKFQEFLKLITESGNSSWKWLQNCYINELPQEQGITTALAVTELFIKKLGKGACRVHGGGFAGVIMALIPNEAADEYVNYMKNLIGENMVYKMSIRNYGAECINRLLEQ